MQIKFNASIFCFLFFFSLVTFSARRSCHKFASDEQERLYLIYNFPTTFGKPESTFTQLYFFGWEKKKLGKEKPAFEFFSGEEIFQKGKIETLNVKRENLIESLTGKPENSNCICPTQIQ